MAGFEPAREGVKVPCLTAWRHPCVKKNRDWDFSQSLFHLGWVMGLEPTTPGTTIQCSNQLSYTHHIMGACAPFWYAKRDSNPRPTA